jgi:uncharacterized protein (TIGR00299 family) protein
MTRVLYLDCSSGISGDMLVGALLALAGDEGEQRLLQSLPAIGIDPSLVHSRPTLRGGLEAREFVVADEPGFASFDTLREAVAESALPGEVRADVAALADAIEAAERAVHGSATSATVRPLRGETGEAVGGSDAGGGPSSPAGSDEAGSGVGTAGGDEGVRWPPDAHLHELAGLDTAVDLVVAASLMRLLAPAKVLASPPALGGGTVPTAHGELAVPPPAVLALLRGLPTAGGSSDDGELTTPTGAALLTHFVDEFGPLPAGVVVDVGVGAGRRALAGRPNVLRAIVVEAPGGPSDTAGRLEPPLDRAELLETNIDDASPEVLAHAAEELRRRGALDVWMTQALMKKGRPGVVLNVLCRPESRAELAAAIFTETTTFGVRVSEIGRLYLDERWATETVRGREVRVRIGFLRGRLVAASAEYEDCAAVAAAVGVPVSAVMAEAQDRARRHFADG